MHDRAHAALAVLAPRQARELPPSGARRSATTCSVQQNAWPTACAHARSSRSSAPARAWAHALAAELRPAGRRPLPEIPPAPSAARPLHRRATPAATPPRRRPLLAGRRAAARARPLPSSRARRRAAARGDRCGGRRRGAADHTGGGGSPRERRQQRRHERHRPRRARARPPRQRREGKENNRITLARRPCEQGPRRRRGALRRHKCAFYLAAEHLPANARLLLRRLALQLADEPRGAQQEPGGRLQRPPRRAARCCPPTRAGTTRMLLTRETSSPDAAGHVVLSGAFALRARSQAS